MTEVWKSQERKFCDICKCWFGDNRTSIQIHEKGKGHQENVKKKLREIAKKGKADAEAETEKERILRMIDDKAKEAVKNDIREARQTIAQASITKAPARQWCIAYTDGKVPYYWNMDSSDTRWEEPEDGFYNVDEQKLLGILGDPAAMSKKTTPAAEDSKECDASSSKATKKLTKEEKRKQRKSRKDDDDRPKPPTPPPPKLPDKPKVHAAENVGKWTVVETLDPEPVESVPPEDIPTPAEPRREKKFEEKTISSLSGKSSNQAPVFKKRKITVNRILKQREDD